MASSGRPRSRSRAGTSSDLEKVQATYEWILANTYREPKVRGCGVGDIKAMQETRNYGGKCGDYHCAVRRAPPIRERARPRRLRHPRRAVLGYKALAVGSATISKAEHSE